MTEPLLKPDLATVRRARKALRTLVARYPGARLELDHTSPLELLIAVVLSAQTTDERVNSVTPALFARYRTAADYATADDAEMQEILRAVGYYRKKTDMVKKLATVLVERHDGMVPTTLEELSALPWVGRKSANMVLGNAFGVPGISVDTHVSRVAGRLGWTKEHDPAKIETALEALFAKKDWAELSRIVIIHGRRTCHAKRPACGACPLAGDCPSFGLDGKGETDPVKARALVKEGV